MSTPEDPASAKMGEGIWRFALREMPGAFVRAWQLEGERLRRAGSGPWHPGNEILQAAAVTLGVWGALTAVLGAGALAVLLPVALWGAFQLTSANYVEHYGLQRRRLADGHYEPCQPQHSCGFASWTRASSRRCRVAPSASTCCPPGGRR